MRLLKIVLADNNKYTLSTFTVTEARYMQKQYRQFQKSEDEANMIRFETDKDGRFKTDNEGNWISRNRLTEAQENRLEQIEDGSLDFLIDVFRKSICRHHPEFKRVDDKEKDEEIQMKLMDLIDLPELRKIVNFSFNGSYMKEEEIIEINFGDEDGGEE